MVTLAGSSLSERIGGSGGALTSVGFSAGAALLAQPLDKKMAAMKARPSLNLRFIVCEMPGSPFAKGSADNANTPLADFMGI